VLKPTHLYPELITGLLKKIKVNGMAHITGGGITENIPSIFDVDCVTLYNYLFLLYYDCNFRAPRKRNSMGTFLFMDYFN
jgi:hypothetical protein